MKYKFVKTTFYIPFFFIMSLRENLAITLSAYKKWQGSRLRRVFSFCIFYIGGLPFCMIQFARLANEHWHETESKTEDAAEDKRSN